MLKRTLTVATATLALASVATPANAQRNLRGTVRIDGSSTVYPITEAVAEEFAGVSPRVRVTVGISGTGGGFKRFVAGETDISDASRPIKSRENQAAVSNGTEYIEIPIAYDGLSIVVNKANSWCDDLTVDELRAIFLDGSKIRTWKDLRPAWPSVPIKIFAPGTDSGTFDYFKEVIAGKTGSIRSDMSVSEDDNVLVRGVSGEKGGIGFFGCSYYFENQSKLKGLKIDGGGGPIGPDPTTIENGTYTPFSRPLFIYVNANAADRPEVKAFVEFYFSDGPALAEEVGYVKLPKVVYDRARANFKNKRLGSQYLDKNGDKVTGSIVDVYK